MRKRDREREKGAKEEEEGKKKIPLYIVSLTAPVRTLPMNFCYSYFKLV